MNTTMKRVSKIGLGLALGLGLTQAAGCASFKLKDPPPGFIEVSSSRYDGEGELRMKAPDNVGLNITTFSNRRGGTLAIWAEDMIKKLEARGYVLERQTAVKSGNGVEGTRFDFSYVPAGSDEQERKFYTAVLFVTDHWRVVVQLAGKTDLSTSHGEDLERILAKIKIRGCKLASKVCDSGQPRTFETTHKPKPNSAGSDDAASGDAGDASDASEATTPAKDDAPAEAKPADEAAKPG